MAKLVKNPHSVITDPLPGIFYKSGFTTIHSAEYPRHFSGTLGKWEDFELEVLKCYHDLKGKGLWENTETLPCGCAEGDHPTYNKGLIQCGMEITVSSRFAELCLKRVSNVGQNLTEKYPGLRLDVGFGDSKI